LNLSSAALAYKSAEAFRTISEVAADLDVPQHVLRFWESRFNQVRPIKRAGGRRYYRPEDVDLLRGIRALLYSDGFTIRGVQKVLRDRGLRHVAEIGRGAVFHLRPVAVDHGEEPVSHQTAENLSPVGIMHREIAAAHAEPDPRQQERAKIERLVAELLQLKARLAGAMARCH
jgi:DNA-binding transcriptional MerR regulator